MKDFEKKIVDQYNVEVKPQFADEHWQSFIDHRKKKKKRRYLIIPFLIGCSFLIFLGFKFITDYNWNNDSIQNEGNITLSTFNSSGLTGDGDQTKAKISVGAQIDRNENHFDTINKDKVQKLNNLTQEPELNGEVKSDFIPSSKLEIDHSDKVIKKIGSTNNLLLSSERNRQHISKPNENIYNFEHHPKNVLTVVQGDTKKPSSVRQRSHSTLTIPFLRSTLKSEIQQYAENKVVLNSKISMGDQIIKINNPLSNKHRFGLLAYTGITQFRYVETFDEQAFQFGGVFKYYLSDRLKIKGIISFHDLNFLATMFNKKIGVRSISAPLQNQIFEKAEINSISTNIGIGLELDVLSFGEWDITIGSSYQVAKEIVRDIDYFFLGLDGNSSDDDSILKGEDIKKYFEINILNLDFGVIRNFPIGSIYFGIDNPIHLSSDSNVYLAQMRFNIGIQKVF